MKVFTATLATETNTFSPVPTSHRSFVESLYAPPGRHPSHPTICTAPLWTARQRAKTKGWTVVEGLCAHAQPSGLVVRRVYEGYRDQILDQLRAALPVDIVAMGLHGAMVADGYDDCEGDLLEHVRRLVGPTVPVGAELDPHCHLTDRMVRNADILICYKESPHTDSLDRAEELLDFLEAMVAGRIAPTTSVYDCRMFQLMPTPDQPMRGFVDRVKALEGKNGVLSISIVHGFTLGDVPDMGTKMLVVTDNRKAEGDALAARLGRELYALRETLNSPQLTMEAALEEAMTISGGPVVIADRADNPGGGAPGDSTYFMRLMLQKRVSNAALGPLWDPVAVRQCFAAGEGGRFDLRFGGKMGRGSGAPIDARVTVLRVRPNLMQSFGKGLEPLGDAAAIDVDGIAVVLNSIRNQAFGIDLFGNMGIDPRSRKVVVVKSFAHFQAAFSTVARKILYTAGPGPLPIDPRTVPLTRVRRPIWPLDPEPFVGAA